MEKIAIISDIHGNLEALNAIFEDIDKKKITKIFCLGDIVGKGSHSKECIDLVLKKCEVVLKGNLEELIVAHENLDNKYRIFYRKQLQEEYISKITGLSFCYELYISGSLVRFFHAAPTSVYDRVHFFEDHKRKITLFYPSDKTISDKMADIVVFGDLHTQLMEKFYNKTLINCGSVGNSTSIIRDDNIDSDFMEVTQAFYLTIEGEISSKEYNSSLSFDFIRVPYNITKELENSNLAMDKAEYEYEIKNGTYRNVDKLKEKYEILS
ncbi:MAG: metallophosphoesterase family protein [Bacilli bacterium]|nr:metallophosphoesterase family protein [Bacilli bacterium]